MTEPCSAKAHGPKFAYYRDGRTTLIFSFEIFRQQRAGDNPDYLSSELFAAGVIGPEAECQEWKDGVHDCYEHEDVDELRLVRTIADAFGLPSPPLAALPPAPSPLDAPPVATEPVGAVTGARPVVAPGTYAIKLAGFLTGFRYDERFGGPDRVETGRPRLQRRRRRHDADLRRPLRAARYGVTANIRPPGAGGPRGRQWSTHGRPRPLLASWTPSCSHAARPGGQVGGNRGCSDDRR